MSAVEKVVMCQSSTSLTGGYCPWLFTVICVCIFLIAGCNNTSNVPEARTIEEAPKENFATQFKDGDDQFSGESLGNVVYLSWEIHPNATYKVYRKNPFYQQAFSLHRTVSSGDDFFQDRNLQSGQDYYYALDACRADGLCERVGSQLRLSVVKAIRPAQGPDIMSGDFNSATSEVTLHWEPVKSAYKYSLWRLTLDGNVNRDGVLIQSVLFGTSTVDFVQETGVRYVYRLKSCSSTELCSVFGDEYAVGIDVNVMIKPIFSNQSFDEQGERLLKIEWNNVPLAEAYEVERSFNSNPYILLLSSSHNEFADSISASVNGQLRFRVRACHSQWGCSEAEEGDIFTITTSDVSSDEAVTMRAGASVFLTPDPIAVQLPEPRILITPKTLYALWPQSLDDTTSDYFHITTHGGEPVVLSASDLLARVDYMQGETIQFLSCSDRFLACSNSFVIDTADMHFPAGDSLKPTVTARLPEVTGISWDNDLPEDFIVITTGADAKFDQLFNPVEGMSTSRHLQINSLNSGEHYQLSAINCQPAETPNIYQCRNESDRIALQIPEYDADIGFSYPTANWSKGQAPSMSFQSADDKKQYHLVFERQCIGAPCLDLTQDINQRLDTLTLEKTPALMVDQQLQQMQPESWNTTDEHVQLDYRLSLCVADWSRCSQSHRVSLTRVVETPYIMAINPARLGKQGPLHISVAHYQAKNEDFIVFDIDRYYSTSLETARARNYQLTEGKQYKSQWQLGSQVIGLNKIGKLDSHRPWYYYDRQLRSSLNNAGIRVADNQPWFIQDDLADLSVEGVSRIVRISDEQICIELNGGAVSCIGESALSSAFVQDEGKAIHLAALDQYISAPVANMQLIDDAARCHDADRQDFTELQQPRSALTRASELLCIITEEGQPYCLNQDIAHEETKSGGSYLCPLTSAPVLNQLEATEQAEHLCSLDDTGTAYCWGNLHSAIPSAPESLVLNPMQVRFFQNSNAYPVIDDLITGEGFSCLSSEAQEYCYSTNYGWVDENNPAQVLFPYDGTVVLDRAAYGSLVCWLQKDNNASYVHCIKGEGQETAFALPEDASVLDYDHRIQAFLLARLSTKLSVHSRLFISDTALCIFDAMSSPSLWCSGDVGWNDYDYSKQTLLLPKPIDLPHQLPIHTFAMSDSGQLCVSYGKHKKLSCWSSKNDEEEIALPHDFWPVLPDHSITHMGLAADYGCASSGASISCWGKTANQVVGNRPSMKLHQAQPVRVHTKTVIADLSVGRETGCYKTRRQWYCWGKVSHFNNVLAEDYNEAVPLSLAVELSLSKDNGLEDIEEGELIETLALASHYHGMCAVTLNDGLLLCSGGVNAIDFDDDEQIVDQLEVMVDIHNKPLRSAQQPIIAGTLGGCALAPEQDGDRDNYYAVYCWGDAALTQVEQQDNARAVVAVVSGVSEDSQLVTASNASGTRTLVAVYDSASGVITVWGQYDAEVVPRTAVFWNLEIANLSFWLHAEPRLLGLTDAGDIYWQELFNPQVSGSINTVSGIQDMVVGTNNICIATHTPGALCAGDNTYGKSGLVQDNSFDRLGM